MVSSTQNNRVKTVVKLRERQHREELGLMLVEGRREVACALQGGVEFVELYACEPWLRSEGDASLLEEARKRGILVVSCTPRVFEKMVFGDRAEGLLGVARPHWISLGELETAASALLLVIEGIEKPGNLGAIFRSADAAGVTGVVLCEPRTDLFNPNAIRSSLGTLFTVPAVVSGAAEALAWLKARRLLLVAATPQGEQVYTSVDYRTPCAILLGSEHAGLSSFWLEAADARVRIPMRGRADSLNLAMSATILAFEAARQRASVSG